MNKLTTVGIDLAKDVIAACVLDTQGAVVERRVFRCLKIQMLCVSTDNRCAFRLGMPDHFRDTTLGIETFIAATQYQIYYASYRKPA